MEGSFWVYVPVEDVEKIKEWELQRLSEALIAAIALFRDVSNIKFERKVHYGMTSARCIRTRLALEKGERYLKSAY